jgi:hypothetical protein
MRNAKPLPEITADWLLERCREEDGCLVWVGHCDNGGEDPRASIDGHKFYVRRAVWAAMSGRQPSANELIGTTCDNARCCDPAHVIRRTRSQALKGVPKSLITRAKIAKAKRRADVPDDAVAQILASPLRGEDEAKRWGMCKSSINKIRNRTMRRDYGSPFAGLGA